MIDIDQDKYPDLYRSIEETVKRRLDWLEETIEARCLCQFLPDEIKELNIVAVDCLGGKLNLTIQDTEGTMITLKRLGIQGLKPQVSSYDSKQFYAKGEGVLPNGTPLSIWVGNLTEPEGCKIIKKRRVRTEYRLVCAGEVDT